MEKKQGKTPEQKLAEYVCNKYVDAQLEREKYYDQETLKVLDPEKYCRADAAVNAYNNILYAMDDIRAGRL